MCKRKTGKHTWRNFCHEVFMKSIKSRPKSPVIPLPAAVLFATSACNPPCFLAFARFLLLAFTEAVLADPEALELDSRTGFIVRMGVDGEDSCGAGMVLLV